MFLQVQRNTQIFNVFSFSIFLELLFLFWLLLYSINFLMLFLQVLQYTSMIFSSIALAPPHQCLQRFEQFKTFKWCPIHFSKYMFLRPLSYLITSELSNAENALEVQEWQHAISRLSVNPHSKMERNRQNHSLKSSTLLPNSLEGLHS